MSLRTMTALGTMVTLFGFSLAACSGGNPEVESARGSDFALMADHVKTITNIDLDKALTGTFERKTRIYAFAFEAKAGATIRTALDVRAGTDAQGVTRGAQLDTIAAVYGPMKGDDKGEKLALSDDGSSGMAAELPALSIKQDGRYLIVLASWDDPGTNGTFSVKAACEGTDFQCRRPVATTGCVNNTRYIQGGTVIGTETWNDCTIVLLEEVHVAANAVLTIAPGVTVKGNFIGTAPYGNVSLVVDGALQAIGTANNPVVFTALQAGWNGLVLKGPSSTLQNVYVEKASRGITVSGSSNTLTDVNVNSGDVGISFSAGSKDNQVTRVKISQINTGIAFEPGAAAAIDDSVIVGKSVGTGTGIDANGAALSQFRRALVAGFADGLRLNATALEVYDGTITNNTRGVTITGPSAGVHPTYTCPSTNFPTVAPPSPPQPTVWTRDPIFVRCDIVKNKDYGIKLQAPELLVVEESNIRNNGAGVVIEADAIHQDSRIVRSNVFENKAVAQVDAWHQMGKLNISGNYWAKISDPELSTSWKVTHDQGGGTCSASGCGTINCGSTYTCVGNTVYRNGPVGYAYYYDNCTGPANRATWTGPVTFTGFSPIELAAGPRQTDLCDMVKDERVTQAK